MPLVVAIVDMVPALSGPSDLFQDMKLGEQTR